MKKLYYRINDGDTPYICTLDVCMQHIQGDASLTPEDDRRSFTITEVWMTEEEFDNMPEAE